MISSNSDNLFSKLNHLNLENGTRAIRSADLEERVRLIAKLSPFLDQDSMLQILASCRMANDYGMLCDLDSILGMFEPVIWQSERPVIPSPSQENLKGEIKLGKVFHGDIQTCDFRIPKSFLLRHVGIYAQTGHAKTTLLYHFMDQLIKDGVAVTYFDPKKDGRVFLKKFKDFLVLPWYAFPWNPLRPPPGMPIEAWWANLSQICGYSFGWFVASSNYLQQHLDILHDRFLETKRIPTLHDLYALISQTTESSRRKSEYHDSVENRIQTLVSVLADNVAVTEGIPLEKLCELPCSIELHGLRPAEANWLVEVILSWFYFYKLYQNHRGEQLRHAIFIDECHRIFDRSKEYRQTAIEMGVPIISIMPSQLRDFQTSLVLASQQPSQVMNAVNANTLIKICGNLSSGQDVGAIAEAMGLDDEQTDCIHRLKRAQWLVRMSDGYTEPFLIETSDYPVERDVSDKEVIAKLNKSFPHCNPKTKEISTDAKQDFILPQLSNEAWELLFDINAHPFRGSMKGISARYSALDFSGRKGTSAKKELLAKKLVTEVDVPLGVHRPVKFLVLTNFALSVLRTKGHDVKLWRHTGHMGFHHQLYTVLIGYTFRRAGYKTFLEKTLKNGKRVDVLTILEGKKVAIEVELGQSVNVESKLNVLKEADELIITTGKDTTFQFPSSDLPDCVRVSEITDFLRWLRSNYYINIHGNNRYDRNKGTSCSKSANKAGKKRK